MELFFTIYIKLDHTISLEASNSKTLNLFHWILLAPIFHFVGMRVTKFVDGPLEKEVCVYVCVPPHMSSRNKWNLMIYWFCMMTTNDKINKSTWLLMMRQYLFVFHLFGLSLIASFGWCFSFHEISYYVVLVETYMDCQHKTVQEQTNIERTGAHDEICIYINSYWRMYVKAKLVKVSHIIVDQAEIGKKEKGVKTKNNILTLNRGVFFFNKMWLS